MPPAKKIRVMIADDHSLLRVGLKQVLESTGEYEVVGQASDGDEAVRLAAELSPQVVLLDVIMPKKDGVEACREILQSAPETRVVMLTASPEEDAVIEALSAGATGYLLKETGVDQLLSTVRDVVSGELRIPAEAVHRVLTGIRSSAAEESEVEQAGLTQREQEILTMFAMGKSYARIAEERGVQPVTIRNAVYGVQRKLQIESMQELVLWAARSGLLDDRGSSQGE
ncbi:MAG: response regulator transcription factor [Chloroflexi bacterium]|nr:response regulator transcription factor [Chloroflexota bacterium]